MEKVSNLAARLEAAVAGILSKILEAEVTVEEVSLEVTPNDFTGDYTLVVFPWVKKARCRPEALAEQIGEALLQENAEVEGYNVVKGFLNLSLKDACWMESLATLPLDGSYGKREKHSSGQTVVVEFSSPNTNKPQHLGHIRNNLLGHSVASLREAMGDRVYRVNLINDRGIHICKSMVAWKRYANGATPESTGIKGDHFVGDYYVRFDKEYRREVADAVAGGKSEEEAKAQAPILLEAQESLRKWEAHDPEEYALWERMNGWVYDGFRETYRALGIAFDKLYYESETYLLGKKTVEEGLEKGVFYRREDGSVWADLREDGLDEKLLLRQDGTSVYMTQDLGTALARHQEFDPDLMVYVVGNEQEYHFQVLRLLFKKLGYDWYDQIFHLSYGMVNLPEGRMKSREGTVVDADDLMEELYGIARATSEELGKLDELDKQEKESIYKAVGLGALKYFILKVDPKRNMLFDPKESIDFNGNTGPFLQYTHARACSVLSKVGADAQSETLEAVELTREERVLLRLFDQYPVVVETAARQYSPALLANFLYDLARSFNQFYHECPIAQAPLAEQRAVRVRITRVAKAILASGLQLLGIVPLERM